MKKLLTGLAILAVVAVGVGFYRGWFALSRPATDSVSGKVNVNLATDVGKMKQDAKRLKDKATDLTSGVKDNDKADGQAGDKVKSNSL